ncbi:hypothetical protein [Pseudomonas sp. CC120222-01a]|uniref:hypothetical protein n=1 Tax=Pseudomonas sp. CC120222-01a TaxID=1378075 RepID=UPI000DA1A40D|nr:hypothetical protein [Pseudomonas sp. CC120222-01a]
MDIDFKLLNRLWAAQRRAPQHAADVVALESVVTPGITWRWFVGEISSPWYSFYEDGRFELVVGRDISNETNITLSVNERQGAFREILTIESSSTVQRTLCQAFPLEGARIGFSGGYYRLSNTEPTHYVVRSGDTTRYPREAEMFLPYLKGDGKGWRTLSLAREKSGLAETLTGYFRRVDAVNVTLFLHREGKPVGKLSLNAGADATGGKSSPPYVGPNEFLLAYYSVDLLLPLPPRGDMAGVLALLAPRSRVEKLRSAVAGIDIWAEVAALASVNEASTAEVPDSTEPGLNPVLHVVSRGDAKIELFEATGGTSVQWHMNEGALGELDSAGGRHWYVPPKDLDAAIAYEEDEKLEGLSVRKSAVSDPLVVDTVTASLSGGEGADAAFLVHNIKQTHYFRMSKEAGRLKLALYYKDRHSNEVLVPDADIEWRVVSGNGRVSQIGAFVPAVLAPSAFTTVLAIEHDDKRWYWACITIPLPMVSVDQVLDMFSA